MRARYRPDEIATDDAQTRVVIEAAALAENPTHFPVAVRAMPSRGALCTALFLFATQDIVVLRGDRFVAEPDDYVVYAARLHEGAGGYLQAPVNVGAGEITLLAAAEFEGPRPTHELVFSVPRTVRVHSCGGLYYAPPGQETRAYELLGIPRSEWPQAKGRPKR